MLATDHGTLRRRALVLFALVVVLDLAHIWLGRGVGSQPELTYGLDVEPSEVLTMLVPAAVGLWLVWLRPAHPIGWLLMACGLSLALVTAGGMYGARALVMPDEGLPGGTWVLALTAPLWIPAVFIPVTVLLVRYPTGTIAGRWPRRFDRLAMLAFVPLYLGYAMSEESVADVVRDRTPPVHPPDAVADGLALLGLGLLVLAAVCIVLDGFRRVVTGRRDERAAILLVLLTAVFAVLLSFGGPAEWFSDLVWQLILVAVAIGVLRYQALGIEVVVRRTLIYASLTGLVLAVFVGVVAGLTQLVPDGPVPQLVAAVLIAVGVAPARDRIQRIIDRMLYGERSEPWSALRRLGGQESASSDLVTDVLAALAGGLHIAGARIEDPDGSTTAAVGECPDDAQAVPLAFAGEEVGTLRLAPRRGESSLGSADLRLLEGVAPLVAAVIHSGRLTDDLRAERARVIDATHSERSRLRQDLHDGLGPSLTGVGLGLEALSSRSGDDTEMVARLRAEVSSCLDEIHRIIDDLRPTALDDHGLVGALRERVGQVAGRSGLAVVLDVPPTLPEVGPDVEAAAFRIADEALTNVVRHAGAQHCTVSVSVNGALCVVVVDDGRGIGDGREGGVGLASMRARAERLGGQLTLTALSPGTEVRAELPLEAMA